MVTRFGGRTHERPLVAGLIEVFTGYDPLEWTLEGSVSDNVNVLLGRDFFRRVAAEVGIEADRAEVVDALNAHDPTAERILMLFLDVAIVNVALPSVQEDLGFAPADLQLVVTVSFGGLLLLGGRAADLSAAGASSSGGSVPSRSPRFCADSPRPSGCSSTTPCTWSRYARPGRTLEEESITARRSRRANPVRRRRGAPRGASQMLSSGA
jgi:hypothetical protein